MNSDEMMQLLIPESLSLSVSKNGLIGLGMNLNDEKPDFLLNDSALLKLYHLAAKAIEVKGLNIGEYFDLYCESIEASFLIEDSNHEKP